MHGNDASNERVLFLAAAYLSQRYGAYVIMGRYVREIKDASYLLTLYYQNHMITSAVAYWAYRNMLVAYEGRIAEDIAERLLKKDAQTMTAAVLSTLQGTGIDSFQQTIALRSVCETLDGTLKEHEDRLSRLPPDIRDKTMATIILRTCQACGQHWKDWKEITAGREPKCPFVTLPKAFISVLFSEQFPNPFPAIERKPEDWLDNIKMDIELHMREFWKLYRAPWVQASAADQERWRLVDTDRAHRAVAEAQAQILEAAYRLKVKRRRWENGQALLHGGRIGDSHPGRGGPVRDRTAAGEHHPASGRRRR